MIRSRTYALGASSRLQELARVVEHGVEMVAALDELERDPPSQHVGIAVVDTVDPDDPVDEIDDLARLDGDRFAHPKT